MSAPHEATPATREPEERHALLDGALEELGAYAVAGRAVLAGLEKDPATALQPLLRFFHSIAGTLPSLGHGELGYLAKLSEDMSRLLADQPAFLPFVRRNFDEIERRLLALARTAATGGAAGSPRLDDVPAASGERADAPLVLVVDDDVTSSRLIETALRAREFRVRVCNEPRNALAILEELAPDLAILDVFMPGVDGFEICRRIRERTCYSYMPILFLSAADSTADLIKGLQLGGDDFLRKPFDPLELLARVQGQINRIGTLKSFSYRDALTGVLNRSYFDRRLEIELRRSDRTGGDLALAIFDVDHFKHVNDAYGHLVGDAALVHIARSMGAQFRSSDVFARYGGEEFALLLLDTSAAQAHPRVARACARVAAEPVPLERPGAVRVEVPVTVSGGLTSYRRGEDDRQALFARADSLLYAAKNAGRDRLVLDPRDGGVLP